MVPGLNPKQSTYAFAIYSLLYYTKNKKRPGLAHIKKVCLPPEKHNHNLAKPIKRSIPPIMEHFSASLSTIYLLCAYVCKIKGMDDIIQTCLTFRYVFIFIL